MHLLWAWDLTLPGKGFLLRSKPVAKACCRMAEGSSEPHRLFAVTLLGQDCWWCVNNSLLQAMQTGAGGGRQPLPTFPSPTACSTSKARAAKLPAHRLAQPWAGNCTEPPVLTARPWGTCISRPVSGKSGGACRILKDKTPSRPRETGGSPAAERLIAVPASAQALLSQLQHCEPPSVLMFAWCLKAHGEKRCFNDIFLLVFPLAEASTQVHECPPAYPHKCICTHMHKGQGMYMHCCTPAHTAKHMFINTCIFTYANALMLSHPACTHECAAGHPCAGMQVWEAHLHARMQTGITHYVFVYMTSSLCRTTTPVCRHAGTRMQSITTAFYYVTQLPVINSYMPHYMAWLRLTKVLQGRRSYYRNRLLE